MEQLKSSLSAALERACKAEGEKAQSDADKAKAEAAREVEASEKETAASRLEASEAAKFKLAAQMKKRLEDMEKAHIEVQKAHEASLAASKQREAAVQAENVVLQKRLANNKADVDRLQKCLDEAEASVVSEKAKSTAAARRLVSDLEDRIKKLKGREAATAEALQTVVSLSEVCVGGLAQCGGGLGGDSRRACAHVHASDTLLP